MSDIVSSFMQNPVMNKIIEHSPLIIAAIFTSLTFVYQNWTGVIYLGYLLAALFLRYSTIWYVNRNTASASATDRGTLCEYNGYSMGFSTFVFMFTFCYAFIPMFIFNDINIPLLVTYIVYFVLDLTYKSYIGKYTNDASGSICTNTLVLLLCNFAGGAIIGAAICTSMMAGGSGKFLFYNEISTSKEMCSVKKEQAFKCKVNK
jgi:hypothetical protein